MQRELSICWSVRPCPRQYMVRQPRVLSCVWMHIRLHQVGVRTNKANHISKGSAVNGWSVISVQMCFGAYINIRRSVWQSIPVAQPPSQGWKLECLPNHFKAKYLFSILDGYHGIWLLVELATVKRRRRKSTDTNRSSSYAPQRLRSYDRNSLRCTYSLGFPGLRNIPHTNRCRSRWQWPTSTRYN